MPAFSDQTSTTVTLPYLLSIGELRRIGLLPDPVQRNLQITASYHVLSMAFANRTGPVANWCTFATWASKQAGVTIRGEDLQRKLEEELENEPEIQAIIALLKQQIQKFASRIVQESITVAAVKKLATSAKDRAGDAVGRGNKKVFEEIGVEFARFIGGCLRDQEYSESSINDFCKMLRPGAPPDGQQHLSTAFRSYYCAFFEPDKKTQDELILLANIEIGLHEQTRLQPEIAESLDAADIDPEQLRNYLTDILVQNKTFKGKLMYFFNWIIGETGLFKKTIDKLVATAEKTIRKVITKHLMTLNLPPDNCLYLAEALTQPYPSNLQSFSSNELNALLKQLKPTTKSIDGAGCTDWADLRERIFYIANLFRRYHATEELFTAPFSDEELA